MKKILLLLSFPQRSLKKTEEAVLARVVEGRPEAETWVTNYPVPNFRGREKQPNYIINEVTAIKQDKEK
jgi:hypothetical protein